MLFAESVKLSDDPELMRIASDPGTSVGLAAGASVPPAAGAPVGEPGCDTAFATKERATNSQKRAMIFKMR